MANIIYKVALTLWQYALLIFFIKLFRINIPTPVFALIIISGLLVWTFTTLCNLMFVRAIQQRKWALFRALLALKANVTTTDGDWRTPLHHALDVRDEPMIRCLLRMPKVRINAADKLGVTPVMQALADLQLPLSIKELFCNHADFNIFYTQPGSTVPILPSIVLKLKQEKQTRDPQLEILLKMKLRSAMEYLHWQENNSHVKIEHISEGTSSHDIDKLD